MRRPLALLALTLTSCLPPPEPTIPRRAIEEPLAARLERTVRRLSTLRSPWPDGQSHEGERHVWQPAQLHEAAAFVENELRQSGCSVHREEYEVNRTGAPMKVWNLVAEVPGKNPASGILVIGAHYDSRVGMLTPRTHGPPRPWLTGTPGANDNASGVAVLLALAREFARHPRERTLRFVAFVCEEPPFFQQDDMGSVVNARRAHARGDQIVGMIALETLGYYTSLPETQRYPFPVFGHRLTSTGDFVSFLSNLGGEDFTDRAAALYPVHEPGGTTPRVIPLSIPAVIDRIAWSDDWSFSREGYPSFCITDTAHQRYNCYHRECDTAEKLSYDKIAGLTHGLVTMLSALANPSR